MGRQWVDGFARTLEIAHLLFRLACKSSLRDLAIEHVQDLFVGDATHLVILLDDLAILITNTAIAGLHQGVAGLVLGADIAVDARPAFVAIAMLALSHLPVFATGKGATCWNDVSG